MKYSDPDKPRESDGILEKIAYERRNGEPERGELGRRMGDEVEVLGLTEAWENLSRICYL